MLSVRDLTISIGTPTESIDIVSAVSFEIERGEILGLVGESGCGKSMTSLAVMGLLDKGGPWVRTGRAELSGFDVINSQPYQRVEAGHPQQRGKFSGERAIWQRLQGNQHQQDLPAPGPAHQQQEQWK